MIEEFIKKVINLIKNTVKKVFLISFYNNF